MDYLPPSAIFAAGFPALLASVLRRGLSLSRGGSWQAPEYSRTCTDIQRLACNILCLKTLLLPCYFSSVVLFTPPIDFWCLQTAVASQCSKTFCSLPHRQPPSILSSLHVFSVLSRLVEFFRAVQWRGWQRCCTGWVSAVRLGECYNGQRRGA